MSPLLRHTLQSLREFLITAGPFVLIGAVLLWVAYEVLDPTPPKRVVLATGTAQGAYAEFGRAYVQALARHGIEVELRATEGSAENLRLLGDESENVDLAFLQGGGGSAIHAVDEDRGGLPLVSLGSLFYEPVWIFYRSDLRRGPAGPVPLAQVGELSGLRLNLGPPGSGGRNLMLKLLHANRIDLSSVQVSDLAPTDAVVALLEGRLDAIVLVSAPESPLVQMLLITPGVSLFEFAQAEAYARRFGFVRSLVLPRGVVDLARDMPPGDVALVAATASMAARETTHPAIMQLVVQAAREIHGGPGWFARAGEFPRAESPELPLAGEAARFYRSGPPLLQRHLPFWLANLIDRMWVVMLSIIAVLIPASRVVPPLYEFRIRSRVFRWYAQLRQIEEQVGAPAEGGERLLRELDTLERRVERIKVPLSHADELYALRSHIEMVRAKLRTAGGGQGG
jgi:ABC-type nitrate/sulfonate/bicarbonate transport system substrate-binding protein